MSPMVGCSCCFRCEGCSILLLFLVKFCPGGIFLFVFDVFGLGFFVVLLLVFQKFHCFYLSFCLRDFWFIFVFFVPFFGFFRSNFWVCGRFGFSVSVLHFSLEFF